MRFVFLLMLSTVVANAQEGVRSSDRMMDADALTKLLSGQIIEFFDGSKSRYASDGSYGYTYTDDGPIWSGSYTTGDDSRVCVDFENGSTRCDMIVMDGPRAVLITTDGLRFPVRNITVDRH